MSDERLLEYEECKRELETVILRHWWRSMSSEHLRPYVITKSLLDLGQKFITFKAKYRNILGYLFHLGLLQ